MPAPDEHMHQSALIKWWSMYCNVMKIAEPLLFAIPNGGRRDVVTGSRLKAEGVRKGVPDLCLAVPAGGFHGLYIEMKRPGGRASKEQAAMIEELRGRGYRAEICEGWVAARTVIEEYLS